MREERTICDSCKVTFDGHFSAGHFKFKVIRGWICEMIGWVWNKVDLCPECFSGLKIVWENKCREIEMRVNPKIGSG